MSYGRSKPPQYYITLNGADNALWGCHIPAFSLCFREKSSVNPSSLARSQPDNCVSPTSFPAVLTGSSALIHPLHWAGAVCAVQERAWGCKPAAGFHPTAFQCKMWTSSVQHTWRSLMKKCGTNCKGWFSSFHHPKCCLFSQLRSYHHIPY